MGLPDGRKRFLTVITI